MAANTLDSLTVNGMLPEPAIVQVRDEGKWTPVANGSSPAWLREVAAEEAAVHGSARIVSRYGEVLETIR